MHLITRRLGFFEKLHWSVYIIPAIPSFFAFLLAPASFWLKLVTGIGFYISIFLMGVVNRLRVRYRKIYIKDSISKDDVYLKELAFEDTKETFAIIQSLDFSPKTNDFTFHIVQLWNSDSNEVGWKKDEY